MRHPRAAFWCLPLLVLLAAPLFACAAYAAGAARPAAGPAPPPFRMSPAWRANRMTIAWFDTLEAHRTGPHAWGWLDSLITVARTRGDRDLLTQTLIKRGGTRVFRGDLSAGLPDLDEALALAGPRRDTLALMVATQWSAYAAAARQQLEPSSAQWRRMRTLARAYGSRSHEGWAEMGLAYNALQAGHLDEAARGYRHAIALHRAGRDPIGMRQAKIGLGRVLDQQGRYREVGVLLREQLADARAAHDPGAEAMLLNNLGTNEFQIGDPSAALEYWEQSAQIMSAMHFTENRRSGPTLNRATALARLFRYEEAAQLLTRLVDVARAAHDRAGEADALRQLGLARVGQERFEEGIRVLRQARAVADSLPMAKRIVIDIALANALEYSKPGDRESFDILTRVIREPALHGDPVFWEAAVTAYGTVLLDLKQPAEALTAADRAQREMADAKVDVSRFRALDMLRAGAFRDLGQPDSAIVAMRRALDELSARRDVADAFDARETLASRSARLLAEYGGMLLEAPSLGDVVMRRRRAFEELQTRTARTLLERLRAPASAAAAGALAAPLRPIAPLSLPRFQRDVLRPGEAFVALHVGSRRSLLFVVTRDRIESAVLPDAWSLRERRRRYLDVVASGDTAVIRAAGEALARDFFGAARPLLATSRRVLLAPDTELLPFALLPLAGDGAPLATKREVALVPSAPLLAELRTAAPRAAARGMLAVSGRSDGAGKPLPGALAETEWLARTYANVEAPRTARARTAASLLATMPRFEVLHLAGHAELAQGDPWASGILLGDAGAPGAWLRASDITRTRLGARLAVLAGCRSVGAVSNGEGALGLSAAFLSAGVTSTLATLWPVDDEATASFVQAFYRRLASGLEAAAALRAAQADMRSRTATAAPRDWAGFVLVGLPETKVTLAPAGVSAPVSAARTRR